MATDDPLNCCFQQNYLVKTGNINCCWALITGRCKTGRTLYKPQMKCGFGICVILPNQPTAALRWAIFANNFESIKLIRLTPRNWYQLKMESVQSPPIHRINHHNLHDFVDKLNNNVNGANVSDDHLLKCMVYEEQSAYKNSIVIASAYDEKQRNSKEIQKLEIYRDRFGIGQKMVYSQKVLLCFTTRHTCDALHFNKCN